MTTSEKAKKAIESKGWKVNQIFWEIVTYMGRDGREGGWLVDIETEDGEEDYFDLFDKAGIDLPINCFNAKDLMAIISKLPINPTQP